MEVYQSYNLEITVEGSAPQCIEGVTLGESLLVQDIVGDDTSWRNYRANLQDFVLGINGVDRGAYAVLRALKRARTVIDFDLRTSDDLTVTTGSGVISSIQRSHPGDGTEPVWSAQISGYNGLTTV